MSICYLCQCQEMLKDILTIHILRLQFIYVNVESSK